MKQIKLLSLLSFYWAIVTLTTVGYGDISPQTPLGQFIATIVMTMGYRVNAVPTGIYFGVVETDTSLSSYKWVPTHSSLTNKWKVIKHFWLKKMYIFSEVWYNTRIHGVNFFSTIRGLINLSNSLEEEGLSDSAKSYNLTIFRSIFIPYVKNKILTESNISLL